MKWSNELKTPWCKSEFNRVQADDKMIHFHKLAQKLRSAATAVLVGGSMEKEPSSEGTPGRGAFFGGKF